MLRVKRRPTKCMKRFAKEICVWQAAVVGTTYEQQGTENHRRRAPGKHFFLCSLEDIVRYITDDPCPATGPVILLLMQPNRLSLTICCWRCAILHLHSGVWHPPLTT